MQEMRNAYKNLVDNLEGTGSLGGCRWEDSTEINFKEIEH
jgi:hypothetical protein